MSGILELRLEDLQLFVEVLDQGSFSKAARKLGIPRPSVSRRIAALEEHAGAELIWRTTRAMRPTAAGTAFYRSCRGILEEADEAWRQLEGASVRPSGTLRIAAPPVVGPRLLGPVIDRYLARFDDVTVDVIISEAAADLRGESFDLGVRIGPILDDSFVARRVGSIEKIVCASPSLVPRKIPSRPSQLRTLPFAIFSECRNPEVALHKVGRGEAQPVSVHPEVRLFSNSFDVLLEQGRAGRAAVVLPRGVVERDLVEGRLLHLCPQWSAGIAPVHLLYAGGRALLPKVRAFLDLLADTVDLQAETAPGVESAGHRR